MRADPASGDAAALERALELALGGRGRVSPNPLVGAVLARDGRTIGEGHHAVLGGPHAEVTALEDARRRGEDPEGATLYVTLEPCAHHGRQPPCSEAILAAGVGTVVIGSDDPSRKAAGRGPDRLREAGVSVRSAGNEQARAARLLNQPFRKHARTGLPLVILKSALSLDGRTASAGGDSKWISGESSRRLVHRWRSECDAVAVGIGTVLADDPLLTARDVDAPGESRQPLRVVFDSQARLPLGSRLLADAAGVPPLVFASAAAPPERLEALHEAGADVVALESQGAEAIGPALAELGRRSVTSLLLEGGASLAGSFRDAGELDEARMFVAPLLLGGAAATPVLGGAGAATVGGAIRTLSLDVERSGEDVLLSARIREW